MRPERGSGATGARDALISRLATGVGCLYCAWLGANLWRNTRTFGKLFEGLGAELPASTRFLVDHGAWLYPAFFGGAIAALVVKELRVEDKRTSTMLTMLVVLVAQFAAQWFTTVYYLPLLDLLGKLSS